MNFQDRHSQFCSVFDGQKPDEGPNEARACSCGYRVTKARQDALQRTGIRATRPLGMSDADFLRTLGIRPEGDV